MIPKRIPNAYSIWLIPNKEKFTLLRNIIIELSPIFEGIKFIPHVTLISNLDYDQKFLFNKVKSLAETFPPFKIYFNEIDYLDEFFQSFFIKIKTNTQLTNARKIALLNFPEITKDYNPHLSLAYGNLNNKIKKKIKKKIQLPIKFFNVSSLYLAHNDEINFKWKIINKFPLIQ